MQTGPTELRSTAVSEPSDIGPETIRQSIRERGEDIKRRELRKAFNRLDARETLTADQRQIVRQMATAIVDDVLAAPEAMLNDDSACDRDTVRIAIEFFDLD